MALVSVGYTGGLGDGVVSIDILKPDGSVRELDVLLDQNPNCPRVYQKEVPTIEEGDLIVADHLDIYIGSERHDSGLVANIVAGEQVNIQHESEAISVSGPTVATPTGVISVEDAPSSGVEEVEIESSPQVNVSDVDTTISPTEVIAVESDPQVIGD